MNLSEALFFWFLKWAGLVIAIFGVLVSWDRIGAWFRKNRL
jgi:hypothetical protein